MKADNYIHLHVIPKENKDLLEEIYPCSGLNMESTWRSHLLNQDKYLIISPKNMISKLRNFNDKDLLNYLSARYWVSQKNELI